MELKKQKKDRRLSDAMCIVHCNMLHAFRLSSKLMNCFVVVNQVTETGNCQLKEHTRGLTMTLLYI